LVGFFVGFLVGFFVGAILVGVFVGATVSNVGRKVAGLTTLVEPINPPYIEAKRAIIIINPITFAAVGPQSIHLSLEAIIEEEEYVYIIY